MKCHIYDKNERNIERQRSKIVSLLLEMKCSISVRLIHDENTSVRRHTGLLRSNYSPERVSTAYLP